MLRLYKYTRLAGERPQPSYSPNRKQMEMHLKAGLMNRTHYVILYLRCERRNEIIQPSIWLMRRMMSACLPGGVLSHRNEQNEEKETRHSP